MALPTWGQECLHTETELIEKVNFDLGHPVVIEEYDLIKRLENSEEKIAELEIIAEKSSRILGMVSSRKHKI